MEEKLIIIHDVDSDETLDCFSKVFSIIALENYLVQNLLKLVDDVLEFEAFIFVPVRFK